MATTLGVKIKELREQKGYTLEKLAELTDSSKSYIWELENKAPPRPSAEKVSKIAEQLGVTIEYLLDDQANITLENATDVVMGHFHGDHVPLPDANPYQLQAQRVAPLCRKIRLWAKGPEGLSPSMVHRRAALGQTLGTKWRSE